MGMSQDGRSFVKIPDELIEELEADRGSAARGSAALTALEQLGAKPPVWTVGEIVAVRGVNFKVVMISRDRLALQPDGWEIQPSQVNQEDSP